jgi:HlyD family secretion protein
MFTLHQKIAIAIVACVVAFAATVVALAPRIGAGELPGATSRSTADNKRWQAVAPGRVEPASGEIRIAAPVVGRIGEVLVNVNDKVFAGEALIRLEDDEVWARLLVAEAQVAVRKRTRDDQAPSGRAANRRHSEDAVADGERSFVEARSELDKAAAAKRAGKASDAEVATARAELTRARDNLVQLKADLRRIESDGSVPLPSPVAGQLNIARSELLGIEAAIEKLTIRAPIGGTVLQVNARAGELAAPSAAQPLVLLGDISALRVRAELDERNFGDVRIGQTVLVRAAAFRGRDFTGKVSSISPIVQSSRIGSHDQRNLTDVSVVEVMVDLATPEPLAVGMKVDVFFFVDTPQR